MTHFIKAQANTYGRVESNYGSVTQILCKVDSYHRRPLTIQTRRLYFTGQCMVSEFLAHIYVHLFSPETDGKIFFNS